MAILKNDLKGLRFGRLAAIKLVGSDGRRALWLCRCACGKEILVGRQNLRSGNTRSCGCLQPERAAETNKRRSRHGMTNSPTWRSWRGMFDRCDNPRDPGYRNYGGRGIKVCKRWRKFENFLTDMGQRPAGLTLERRNNDKGYCPSNCVWATHAQQMRNRRVTRFITFKGVTLSIKEWAKKTGVKYHTLWSRLKSGWSVEMALTREVSQ